MKTISLAVILLFNVTCIFAQQAFKYRAALEKVNADGFYKINLQPGLVAKSEADLTDVRIISEKKQFVPYIFGNQLILKSQQNFIDFPDLKVKQQSDTTTVFVADNKDRLTISELYVQLRNTSVQRSVNLSGSDDLNKWYAIKEGISLAEAGERKSDTYEQLLNFPSSNYRYLRVTINNDKKESVAILRAGVYKQQYLQPAYVPLKGAVISQKDTGGLSRVIIRFPVHYKVNKLHLNLEGQKYYRRKVLVYQIADKQLSQLSEALVSSAAMATGAGSELKAGTDLIFSGKTNTIVLEIFNGDNPSLKVSNVIAYQLEQSLVSYLEKGTQYYLLTGDPKAIAADYDLKFFTDSLHLQIPKIGHGELGDNPLYTLPEKQVKEKSVPAWLMWAAIASVLIILGLLTYKMVQEVNKRTVGEKKE